MPYTKDDYPASLKNFDEATRLKAIDIINAMLKDGYEEDQAIPIGISQAKEWKDSASKKDIKDLKNKDITNHQKSDKSGARLTDADVIVQYREDESKWEVRSEGAERADSLHDTKKEAEKRGRQVMDYREGELVIKNKNE